MRLEQCTQLLESSTHQTDEKEFWGWCQKTDPEMHQNEISNLLHEKCNDSIYIFPWRSQIVMPLTLHSESFACTCLAIGKNSAIVPGQDFLHKRGSNNFVDINLLRGCAKHPVESKWFGQRTLFHYLHLFIVSSRCLNHNGWPSSLLLTADRPGKKDHRLHPKLQNSLVEKKTPHRIRTKTWIFWFLSLISLRFTSVMLWAQPFWNKVNWKLK